MIVPPFSALFSCSFGDVIGLFDKAKKVIDGEISIQSLKNQSPTNDSALMSLGNTKHLTALKNSMKEHMHSVGILEKAVTMKMEQVKSEMEHMKRQLSLIADDYIKQIKKIIGKTPIQLN